MGVIKTFGANYLDPEFIRACKELPFVTSDNINPGNTKYLAQGVKLWRHIETSVGIDIDLATILNAYAEAAHSMDSALSLISDELRKHKYDNSSSNKVSWAIERIDSTRANILACDASSVARFVPYDAFGRIVAWLNTDCKSQLADQVARRQEFYDRVWKFCNDLPQCANLDTTGPDVNDISCVNSDAYCYIKLSLTVACMRALERANAVAYEGDVYGALQANLKMGKGNKSRDWKNMESIMVSLYGIGYSMSLAQYIMIATRPTFKATR